MRNRHLVLYHLLVSARRGPFVSQLRPLVPFRAFLLDPEFPSLDDSELLHHVSFCGYYQPLSRICPFHPRNMDLPSGFYSLKVVTRRLSQYAVVLYLPFVCILEIPVSHVCGTHWVKNMETGKMVLLEGCAGLCINFGVAGRRLLFAVASASLASPSAYRSTWSSAFLFAFLNCSPKLL